jgi:hypothetical protein
MSTVTPGKRVQDFVDTTRQLFIDGSWVDAKSHKTFETLNQASRPVQPQLRQPLRRFSLRDRLGKFNASGVGELPTLPGSVSAGPAADTATTEARTFFLQDTTSQAAVVAYGALLHGWRQRRVPHPEGTTDFAATWIQGNHQLEVSAAPAPKRPAPSRAHPAAARTRPPCNTACYSRTNDEI